MTTTAALQQRASRTHRLYRWFDENGTLLYVGITSDPIYRMGQHYRTSRWADFAVTITLGPVLPDEATARELESVAIRTEGAVFNRALLAGPFDAEYEYLCARGRGHLFRGPRTATETETGTFEAGPVLGPGEAARCLQMTVDRLKAIPRDDLGYHWTPAGQRRYWGPDLQRYGLSNGIDVMPVDDARAVSVGQRWAARPVRSRPSGRPDARLAAT